MPRSATKSEPQIVDMPAVTMAVVETVGDPNVAAGKALRALYASVYTLKFALKKQGRDFNVTCPRARWPNAHLAAKDEWAGI